MSGPGLLPGKIDVTVFSLSIGFKGKNRGLFPRRRYENKSGGFNFEFRLRKDL